MRTEISRLQDRYQTTTVYVTHDQTEARTLADRVAVMRHGEVLQVASPRELYNNPVDIFVAGFIGSPSMNFLPGELQGDLLDLEGATIHLPESIKSRLPDPAPKKVVVGVRPEHFEDAALVDDKSAGVIFRAHVDVIEWMGSELYVYFQPPRDDSLELDEVAPDLATGGDVPQHHSITARLDPASMVQKGEDADLWIDVRRILLFDPDSGENLLYKAPVPDLS